MLQEYTSPTEIRNHIEKLFDIHASSLTKTEKKFHRLVYDDLLFPEAVSSKKKNYMGFQKQIEVNHYQKLSKTISIARNEKMGIGRALRMRGK